MSSGRCTQSRNAPLVVPEELEALADESRRRRGQAPHKPNPTWTEEHLSKLTITCTSCRCCKDAHHAQARRTCGR
eukprot:scaffold3923_cov138-Pinguiococcus_pyrenoidosus.AAC.1